jgi:hypothetical protein
MLPTILHHIDSILIARQASDSILSSAINTSSALLALTPRKTSGDLHHSYERLEFLGDTLLKLIGTVDVFARPIAQLRNVEVEKERHLMLSNRMLHKCGEDAGIPPYIRNGKFMAKSWMPHGWRREDGQTSETPSQTIGLKVSPPKKTGIFSLTYRSLPTLLKLLSERRTFHNQDRSIAQSRQFGIYVSPSPLYISGPMPLQLLSETPNLRHPVLPNQKAGLALSPNLA